MSICMEFSKQILPLHMGLVYYKTPPGVQMLHCLKFVLSIQSVVTMLYCQLLQE